MFLCFISCEKQSVEVNDLSATWKLTEYLADPGDGNGKFQAYKGTPIYLKIYSDSTAQRNYPTSDKLLRSVSMGANSALFFHFTDGSIIGRRMEMRKGNLVFWENCIEGCASLFTKLD